MFERRNVIAAAVVAMLVLLRVLTSSDPPPTFHAELARIAQAERDVLNRFQAAGVEFKSGRFDDRRFAEIVERDVLPSYLAVRAELESLSGLPDTDVNLIQRLTEYMRLRESAWGLLIEALREQDTRKLDSHKEKMDAAAAMMRGLLAEHQPQ